MLECHLFFAYDESLADKSYKAQLAQVFAHPFHAVRYAQQEEVADDYDAQHPQPHKGLALPILVCGKGVRRGFSCSSLY